MSVTTHAFFDPATCTVSYVVACNATRAAAIIDPVLDYDFRSGCTATRSADRILDHVNAHGLRVQWILETHAHADHLSSARYLKHHLGGAPIAIGQEICEVQRTFQRIYNLDSDFVPDGRQFDRLLADGESIELGQSQVLAMHVPGHTPADLAYVVDGVAFIGDTMFMPDVGTARADFPGGDAARLYQSIRRLLSLPSDTTLYVCHDYPPLGRAARWASSVEQQRRHNVHVHDGVSQAQFVSMRTARDATLDMPMLILPALQVNVRAGEMPPPESNGVSYLKIPVNAMPHRPK
jgi:glyoxylase-like metal-dependent hydrolase (beta-lactamase superfamily II)